MARNSKNYENLFKRKLLINFVLNELVDGLAFPIVRLFFRFPAQDFLKTTGNEKDLTLPTAKIAQSDKNEFKRLGPGAWAVCFKGKETVISNNKRVRYLATLLERPGEQLDTLGLYRCLDVNPDVERNTKHYKSMKNSGDNITVYDSQLIPKWKEGLDENKRKTYEQAMKNYLEELNFAEGRGD